ncbi:glucoamylase family protein [Algoriphagus sp.]|uniref:glucoamylase family protein n=1 Tax=Algoriphagus sp. TaxID=1872435 RepID=UPI00391BD6F3
MKSTLLFIPILFCLSLFSCQNKAKDSETIEIDAYEQHVEIRWNPSAEAKTYSVWASLNGDNFIQRGITTDTLYLDFVSDLGTELKLSYEVRSNQGQETVVVASSETATRKMTEEELLDMVQYYTFRYFWHGAEPMSGMAAERIHLDGDYPDNDAHIITTGGTGFGLFGLIAGIERGWITREQGLVRMDRIVSFLEKADRYHGIWAHWIDGQTGKTKAFSPKDNGADLVESAFLMQGLLAIREYYKDGTATEKAVADRINTLWKEMDWTWHTQGARDVLYWHWSPEYEWEMNFPLEGYNECLITYVLAAASPTYTIEPEVYHKGWARGGGIKANVQAYDMPLQLIHNGAEAMGGPLFWAHYSFLGLNPMGLKDQYADYEQENRNQTLINRAWCIENPGNFKGYGESLWGLTASYSINFYNAHHPGNDTGVISPTAAISSVPYTPKESMEVIKNLYYNYGEKVFGKYGFYDAMSPHHNYFPTRYLAIDQGPMVAMIENYRTGLGWKLFMGAPEVKAGLEKLGFTSPNL